MRRADLKHVHIYKEFRKVHPEKRMSQKDFYSLLCELNQTIARLMLETGDEYVMGNKMGSLQIWKVKRTKFNKVNFKATADLRKEGLNKTAFWIDDYYYMWGWNRHKCMLTSKTLYRFVPTRGVKGLKGMLHKTVTTDEYAPARYKYVDPDKTSFKEHYRRINANI